MTTRTVDPETQCEVIQRRPSRLMSRMLMYMSIANMTGLIDMPKKYRKRDVPPWYYVNLTKTERRSLSYEDQQELKRYRWTLKQIRDREVWPGMIL